MERIRKKEREEKEIKKNKSVNKTVQKLCIFTPSLRDLHFLPLSCN